MSRPVLKYQWSKDKDTRRRNEVGRKIYHSKPFKVRRTELLVETFNDYHWIFTIDQEEEAARIDSQAVHDYEDNDDNRILEGSCLNNLSTSHNLFAATVTHMECWVQEFDCWPYQVQSGGWIVLDAGDGPKAPEIGLEWVEVGLKKVQQIRDRQLAKKELQRKRKEKEKRAVKQSDTATCY